MTMTVLLIALPFRNITKKSMQCSEYKKQFVKVDKLHSHESNLQE